MTTEPKYFNCSEDHAINYVAGLYEDTAGVKQWLKDKCENGTICYTTHADLYNMLEEAGYTRK